MENSKLNIQSISIARPVDDIKEESVIRFSLSNLHSINISSFAQYIYNLFIYISAFLIISH